MEPVTLAYIGTSSITQQCLDASLLCPEIKPYGLLSRSPQRGKELAQPYNIPHIFSSLEALAQSPVEAVYIASPNALHYRQAKVLLDSGKHLLIEKPFTLTLAQAEELIGLAAGKGLMLMEAVIPAYCPNFLRLLEYLPKIGAVQGAEFSFGKISSKWEDFQKGKNVNIFSPAMGGGSLMDIGVYSLWMMSALLGKPTALDHRAEILSSGVDGRGKIFCTYPSFEVKITHSKISDEGSFFEINGSHGILRAEGFSKMDAVFYAPKGAALESISLPQYDHRMTYELKYFAQAVRKGNQPAGLDTTLLVMEILDEARRQSGIIFPS